MRHPLVLAALALLLAFSAKPALSAIAFNGLFDKGTALSDTHVEVTGIELPASIH